MAEANSTPNPTSENPLDSMLRASPVFNHLFGVDREKALSRIRTLPEEKQQKIKALLKTEQEKFALLERKKEEKIGAIVEKYLPKIAEVKNTSLREIRTKEEEISALPEKAEMQNLIQKINPPAAE